MRLVVIQTGRLRDAQAIAWRDEYVKRFSRFGSLTVVEREAKGDDPLWPKSARWKVALDERGKLYDSPSFAQQLQRWTMSHGEVAFCIGESHGHHAPTLATADARWALGPMVLPHALAHVVVIEQLYRAGTILAGIDYHH